jgi:hypothetical protein
MSGVPVGAERNPTQNKNARARSERCDHLTTLACGAAQQCRTCHEIAPLRIVGKLVHGFSYDDVPNFQFEKTWAMSVEADYDKAGGFSERTSALEWIVADQPAEGLLRWAARTEICLHNRNSNGGCGGAVVAYMGSAGRDVSSLLENS